MEYTFETMTEVHRKSVIDIFNYFVENSFAAYPDSKFSYEAFDRFMNMSDGWPRMVIKTEDDKIIGFGFLHPYLPYPTFKHTLEITYFILPEHTHKGLGRRIFDYFVSEAREMGINTFLASISSRNEQNLAFHRKLGFKECGRFRDVSKKLGQSFDVVWMQTWRSP